MFGPHAVASMVAPYSPPISNPWAVDHTKSHTNIKLDCITSVPTRDFRASIKVVAGDSLANSYW